MTTIAEVGAVLDPTLTRRGFAPGQDGGHGSDECGDIIWCALFADVRTSFPWLPQMSTPAELSGHECFDLRVSLALGTLVDVDLEGVALPEALQHGGRAEDAAEAAALLGSPAGPASARLVPVLTRLFEPPVPTVRGG